MSEPTKTNDEYWVYWRRMSMRDYVGGKWMLFYPKNILDEKWNMIKNLYNDEILMDICSMKCSTNKPNPRSSSRNNGVIILYCSSGDEGRIMNAGENILKNIGPYPQPYIYYKSNGQTRNGTGATGNQKNYIYKIKTNGNNDNPFI